MAELYNIVSGLHFNGQHHHLVISNADVRGRLLIPALDVGYIFETNYRALRRGVDNLVGDISHCFVLAVGKYRYDSRRDGHFTGVTGYILHLQHLHNGR